MKNLLRQLQKRFKSDTEISVFVHNQRTQLHRARDAGRRPKTPQVCTPRRLGRQPGPGQPFRTSGSWAGGAQAEDQRVTKASSFLMRTSIAGIAAPRDWASR